MAEVQQITTFPWQPRSTIRGNLAMGNLHNALLQWLKSDRGVHVETLAAAAGVLTGFAAQGAALADGADATSQAGAVPGAAIVLLGTKSGERFLSGDWINKYLLEGRLTLWSFATAKAMEAGVLQADLPDIRDIVSHVVGTVGGDDFGVVRVAKEHQPQIRSRELLKVLWPRMIQVMQLPLPDAIKDSEPPLEPIYWPVIAGIVAAAFIVQAKGTLDPRLSYTILMESAVAASKYDPETIDPGKWRFETRNGALSVFRVAT
jgi:hypothetical protein